jgi:hypothetical protein
MLIEGKIIQPLGMDDKFQIRRGTFYHGRLCGNSCELQTPRLHYHGQFSSFGHFDGKGRCEFADGLIMDGFWERGDFNRGLVKLNDGSWYIGEWSDIIGWVDGNRRDKRGPHGYGTRFYSNGDVATGYWDNADLINGRVISADGSIKEKSLEQPE